MTIPMPGHGYAKGGKGEIEARQSIATLEALIDEHDVIFLGTDTRESRWLPTCICAAKDKMCINVALGFDNFLVMRHGSWESKTDTTDSEQKDNQDATSSNKNRLGCYFCADIVAPKDSLTGRTLDQQCTVTRPGLAPIAAGLAAELCIALWTHPR